MLYFDTKGRHIFRHKRSTGALAALGLMVMGLGPVSADIAVHDAWSRATPLGYPTGAVYLEITSDGPRADTLVSVGTQRSPRAELHRTIEEGGNSRMVHTPRVSIPADARVQFEPGGRHVMLMGLEQALREGNSYQITLTFEDAGALPVELAVRAPTAMAYD